MGKSSLLNALLGVQRAIVTAVPGTTRDTLEESINLDGIPLCLVDTAGLAEAAGDSVEALGMERSRAALAGADLALWVVDASEPLAEADRALAPSIRERPAIMALNKSDLPGRIDEDELGRLAPAARLVRTSALTGQGIAALESTIHEAALSGMAV